MLKILGIFICLIYVNSFCNANPEQKRFERASRTFWPILDKLLNSQSCGARACPNWKCQDDSAVIHGYCCGCPGSQYDNVPVPCKRSLRCPLSPYPLCSDYDFMMNCCCTGP